MIKKVYDIFKEINGIPRPSHHEGKIADFLCEYAGSLGLEYDRDAENCVVIRKPASPGYENAEPIVLLNHMDMVAVSDGTRQFDPINDPIESYEKDGWMYANGTSLGADNGIGLSMALAVLADKEMAHPALEVLTTTNEEDGMSGAANLSLDFVKGRKVINLDSEDYDTITVGAAGAYLQIASFPIRRESTPSDCSFFKLSISGGQGGHSGVDINKNRCNANKTMCSFLFSYRYIPTRSKEKTETMYISEINGGDANASIPSMCTAIVGVPQSDKDAFVHDFQTFAERTVKLYQKSEPKLAFEIESVESPDTIIADDEIPLVVYDLPCGPLKMREDMPGTVMTSNNVGVIRTNEDVVTISCHTRSFSNEEMENLAESITEHFRRFGASVEIMMNTPGWQENQDSDFLALVDRTFNDVLSFHPRKVAMHFVLEAGYYVQKYPGIEIACIGPRIVEPHSAKERVEIETINNIWKVLVELLSRLKA